MFRIFKTFEANQHGLCVRRTKICGKVIRRSSSGVCFLIDFRTPRLPVIGVRVSLNQCSDRKISHVTSGTFSTLFM